MEGQGVEAGGVEGLPSHAPLPPSLGLLLRGGAPHKLPTCLAAIPCSHTLLLGGGAPHKLLLLQHHCYEGRGCRHRHQRHLRGQGAAERRQQPQAPWPRVPGGSKQLKDDQQGSGKSVISQGAGNHGRGGERAFTPVVSGEPERCVGTHATHYEVCWVLDVGPQPSAPQSSTLNAYHEVWVLDVGHHQAKGLRPRL